jgi:hypothetical protein
MPDWVGIGGLITGLIAAVVAGWSAYRSQRVGEVERVCDRQERYIAQMQAALAAHQAQLEICHREREEDRVDLANVGGWLRTFRDGWLREVRRSGGDPADVPDLPPPRHTPEELAKREFEWRTLAQTALLLQQASPGKSRPEKP